MHIHHAFGGQQLNGAANRSQAHAELYRQLIHMQAHAWRELAAENRFANRGVNIIHCPPPFDSPQGDTVSPRHDNSLKQQLQSELYTARRACRRYRAKGATRIQTIGAWSESCIDKAQIYVIVQIERFRPELHVKPFRNVCILDKREVAVEETWIPQVGQSPAGIAVCIVWRINKS